MTSSSTFAFVSGTANVTVAANQRLIGSATGSIVPYMNPGSYSIYYTDMRYSMYGGGSDGDLRKMSSETGGRVFSVSRNRTLQQIFTEIDEEMRSQYTIGYAPQGAQRDGAFHQIEIRTDNKDHRVAARKGYYAQ